MSDCWGNKYNKKIKNNNQNKKYWHFKRKCNYCGIYGNKERDCHKKEAQESKENKANVAKEVKEEESVLINVNRNQFEDKVCQALSLNNHEDMVMICMER